MWSHYQFFVILFVICLTTVYHSTSLPQFAVYSELLWLVLFSAVGLVGATVDCPILLSGPFIVLVLTAVEAVIIWSLIVYSYRLSH